MNKLKLYGSIASPFARRIRIRLLNQKYDFIKINVFDENDIKELEKHSPTRRIPILKDGDRTIWDSYLITEYIDKDILKNKQDLFLINEMTDAGIQLFQLRKFEIDKDDINIFSKNNIKRINNILSYFNSKDLNDELTKEWLFCTLDWFLFREVYDWSTFKKLKEFFEANKTLEKYKKTDPRIG
jgi:glutathione S-transferase